MSPGTNTNAFETFSQGDNDLANPLLMSQTYADKRKSPRQTLVTAIGNDRNAKLLNQAQTNPRQSLKLFGMGQIP